MSVTLSKGFQQSFLLFVGGCKIECVANIMRHSGNQGGTALIFGRSKQNAGTASQIGGTQTNQVLPLNPLRCRLVALFAGGALVRPEAFAEDAGSGENYIEDLCQRSGHERKFVAKRSVKVGAYQICG
jgi:hypothetical protein